MTGLKLFITDKLIPIVKKIWMDVVNLFVVLYLYGTSEGWPEAISGFWAFVLLGYYIFWKLLGVEKMVNSKNDGKSKN